MRNGSRCLAWMVAIVCAGGWAGLAAAESGPAEAERVLSRILELKTTTPETPASVLSGEMEELQGRYVELTAGLTSPAAGDEKVLQIQNDQCAGAITVAVPSVTAGDTTGALTDSTGDCGTLTGTSPDVYYEVIGTGNTMTASFCNGGGAANHDTKISVYCDTCATLTCVGGNDDSCGLQSEFSWCSQAGFPYIILVHGFGGSVGPFNLAVFDDGSPCQDQGLCSIVPVELVELSAE